MNELVTKLRKGELDCNNQQLFFSSLLKAMLTDMRSLIKIRNIPVPHMIINTGDDVMWLLEKDYDYSKEPCEVTNEQYIYQTVPRCVVSPGAIDMLPDQLTNPYTRGTFQFETDSELHTFSAEFRRLPIKIQINLKYVLDSFTDALEMMQHICTKLTFVRIFNFVYLGQTISATYKVPDSFEDQHMAEISGDIQESRRRTIDLQIEVESNLPVFEPRTIMDNVYIAHPIQKLTDQEGHEIATRDYASRSGYRGSRFGKR